MRARSSEPPARAPSFADISSSAHKAAKAAAPNVNAFDLRGVVELIEAEVDRAAGRWEGLVDRTRRLAHEPTPFAAANLDAQVLYGSVLAASGSTGEATACLRDVIAAAEQVGAVWPLIPARTSLSRLLLMVGDARGALEQATAGLTCVRSKGIWVWGAETALCLVDALDALNRATEARGLVNELKTEIGDADAPIARAALNVAQAVIARDLGEEVEAEALLRDARRELAAGGLSYEEALVDERLGEWLCNRGGSDGPDLLRRALQTFGRLDARRDVARICRTMRHLGVRIPDPWRGGRRSYGAALSPREREIALLAAGGKTNQEIATDLFLSRRTVESHMSSVLRKLSGRSRKDLRGLLTSNGESRTE
jgi:DNA-binding CsgD family transcriptional regulator